MTNQMRKVRKFSKQRPFIRFQGFLAPKVLPTSGRPEKYQIVCGKGENYIIDALPIWDEILHRMCWENVVIGGFYNKRKQAIEPLYIARNDKYKPQKGYSDLPSDEEKDLSFYQQRIHNTGVLEPAA